LAVNVVGSSVCENIEALSDITSSPLFVTLNLVVPDEEAESMSPLFVWLTISVAFDPIPPDIESGAGVFETEPILTPVS